MKVRTFLLGVLLGAALVIPALSAQNESIISGSTFGLFTDDVDDYMDPNDYENVEFDNAFIYLKGSQGADGYNGTPRLSSTSANPPGDTSSLDGNGSIKEYTGAGIQGGLATRFGSLYLGFAFETRLWNGNQTIRETDGDRKDPNTGSEPRGNGRDPITFNGDFGLLVGTGNIGAFKLELKFDDVSLESKEFEDNGTNPDKASYSTGSLLIDLGWGKNFEVKGGVLAPEVHIGYQISTYKADLTDPDSFSYISNYSITSPPPSITNAGNREEWFENMSHLTIRPGVEYTSATGTHWFGGEYELDIGIHPKTIIDDGNDEYDWKGYDVKNTLGGQYKRNVSLSDRFALVLSGALAFQLRSSKVDYTDLDDPVEYVDFGIIPTVALGVTYDFAKKPFQLYSALQLASNDNTNGDVMPLYRVNYTKFTNVDDVKSWRHEFTPWGLDAGLGLKFTPFKNFSLDIGLSQNLTYYVSDKLEYVWSYDLFDWDNHPFTAELQITFRF